MALTLGAQLYTVRAFTKTQEDIEKTLRRIKEMGFRTIQISGFGPFDVERVAALVKELDLYVCSTHTPLKRYQEELPQVIKEHRMLGCDTLGLGSMPGEYWENGVEGTRDFVKMIAPIAHEIHEEGLQFTYHNHNQEFIKDENGVKPMDILFDETDPDDFNFILDTYWLQLGGVSPVEYIQRAKNRMKVCHFKDFAVDKNRTPYLCEVGKGNINFHACYKACMENGVKDIVIEQDTCPGDPFESLAISFENLKKISADCEK